MLLKSFSIKLLKYFNQNCTSIRNQISITLLNLFNKAYSGDVTAGGVMQANGLLLSEPRADEFGSPCRNGLVLLRKTAQQPEMLRFRPVATTTPGRAANIHCTTVGSTPWPHRRSGRCRASPAAWHSCQPVCVGITLCHPQSARVCWTSPSLRTLEVQDAECPRLLLGGSCAATGACLGP